ncbi:MAG: tetratricopeptide repeat protein [Chloroflexota bacterium]
MTTLHKEIDFHFNLADLKQVCFELGFDIEHLPDGGKMIKIIELLIHFQQTNRLALLKDKLQEHRPSRIWDNSFKNLPNFSQFRNQNLLSIPNQLPTRPEHFIGRENEIDMLVKNLQPSQKVTLWATGGMGKTAIAIETLYRLDEQNELLTRFPDGIIFFSFYGQGQNENLYQHLIHTYNLIDTNITLSNAMRYLEGKQMLLIFDGAEEAEDLVQAIQLQQKNGLLITTRDRRSSGGKRIEVGLLPVTESKDLLREWCQTELDEVVAEQICAAIGRLPLAIRLAGRYLGETGELPTDYLHALQQDPIYELHQGEHQIDSIEILLRRTVSQLDASSQTSIALLGWAAFLPIPIETLEIVVKNDLRQALNQLNRNGIIERDVGFAVLTHALIYTFARYRMETSLNSITSLIKYYIQFLKKYNSRTLSDYKTVHHHIPHILSILDKSLEEKHWFYSNQLALYLDNYFNYQGMSQKRIEVIKQGIQSANAIYDSQSLSIHLTRIGNAYRNVEDFENAIKYLQNALALSRTLGLPSDEAGHLNNLGITYREIGQIKFSINCHKQALAISRKIGFRLGEGNSLSNLGLNYRVLEQREKELQHHEQALEIANEINNIELKLNSLNNLGIAYKSNLQIDKAIDCFEKTYSISVNIENRRGEGSSLCNLGLSYWQKGNKNKARDYLLQSLHIFKEIHSPQAIKVAKWLNEIDT